MHRSVFVTSCTLLHILRSLNTQVKTPSQKSGHGNSSEPIENTFFEEIPLPAAVTDQNAHSELLTETQGPLAP